MMVHEIDLVDFERRLARGEARDDGVRPEEEFIHFELGNREIRLQVTVRHNGDGMDEGNLVTIAVANRSADGFKVCLTAILRRLDFTDQLVDLTKKENVALEHGKRFTLFGFKATDVQSYCANGNLHLRLEVSECTDMRHKVKARLRESRHLALSCRRGGRVFAT